MARLMIDKIGDYWAVLFADQTGMSILAKTKSKKYALKIRSKFASDYRKGILLRPYKSAYK